MKRTMRVPLFLVGAIFILTPVIFAETFKPSKVSAEARWAVHLDLERLISSRIGEHFLAMVKVESDMEEFDDFCDALDFDPFEDLHSITAYGKSFIEEEGVVLAKGRFDKEKVKMVFSFLDKEDIDYDETEYNDHVIYVVSEGGDRFYFSFHQGNFALGSNKRKLLKEALDVLSGEKESLADAGKLKNMRSLPEGTIFAAAAKGFGELVEEEPEAAIVQKAESALLTLGELEGENFLRATLVARDKETAKQIYDIAKGFIALGSLLEDQEPELKELARFIRSAKFSLEGKEITFSDSKPAEELIKLLKKVMD